VDDNTIVSTGFLDEWAQEFVRLYLSYIETFLICLRDPAFEAEREWRLK